MEKNPPFVWKRYPEAEKWLEEKLNSLVAKSPTLQKFSRDLEMITSTRLMDWLSHISVKEPPPKELGFIEEALNLYMHPGAQFPRVTKGDEAVFVVTDNISTFLMMHQKHHPIEGTPYAPFRQALVTKEAGVSFYVVERRGTRAIEPITENPEMAINYLKALELWRTHPRKGMDLTIELAKSLVKTLGKDRAAYLVLEVEREYWQNRNLAGQIQKARQDRLGLGWSNHDHHTFRSSRENFHKLVEFFEILGFHSRERFYAGDEAGWGAQVMENANVPAVLFLDVDLNPHEIIQEGNWSALKDQKKLGTVGLWCALHGDSILEAGMHHLEAQFEFDKLREDLKNMSVGMMQPFSDFTYLKQAFTDGERWKVDPKRIDHLLETGQISASQAEKFHKDGAIGSHLENLQRREGYKGFNQKNVSHIIKETDPRKWD